MHNDLLSGQLWAIAFKCELGTAKDSTSRPLHEPSKPFSPASGYVLPTVPAHTVLLGDVAAQAHTLATSVYLHGVSLVLTSWESSLVFSGLLHRAPMWHKGPFMPESASIHGRWVIAGRIHNCSVPTVSEAHSGSDAKDGCFKDDINIQMEAWLTVLFVVGFALHAPHCVLPTWTADQWVARNKAGLWRIRWPRDCKKRGPAIPWRQVCVLVLTFLHGLSVGVGFALENCISSSIYIYIYPPQPHFMFHWFTHIRNKRKMVTAWASHTEL